MAAPADGRRLALLAAAGGAGVLIYKVNAADCK